MEADMEIDSSDDFRFTFRHGSTTRHDEPGRSVSGGSAGLSDSNASSFSSMQSAHADDIFDHSYAQQDEHAGSDTEMEDEDDDDDDDGPADALNVLEDILANGDLDADGNIDWTSARNIDMLADSAAAEHLFEEDCSILDRDQQRVVKAAMTQVAEARILDITKVMENTYLKNPLTTRMILTKGAGTLFKNYQTHGSQARLGQNVMQFLSDGHDVFRRTMRTQAREMTVPVFNTKPGAARFTKINVQERLPGEDRARLRFDPIPSRPASSPYRADCTTSANNLQRSAAVSQTEKMLSRIRINNEDGVHQPPMTNESRSSGMATIYAGHQAHVPGKLTHEIERAGLMNLHVRTMQSYDSMGRLFEFQVANDGEHKFSTQDEDNMQNSMNPHHSCIKQNPTRVSQRPSPNGESSTSTKASTERIPSIQEMLPPKVKLNHDHPFTMTNDPQTHELLDPDHPNHLAFDPVNSIVRTRPGRAVPAGLLEPISNIFKLHSIAAQQLLSHLILVHTPSPTAAEPIPPAPPYALFRAAIHAKINAEISSTFLNRRNHPLGIPISLRSILRDLRTDQDFSYGRAGHTAIDAATTPSLYYPHRSNTSTEPWNLGHEHVTDNDLNRMELLVLARVAGRVVPGVAGGPAIPPPAAAAAAAAAATAARARFEQASENLWEEFGSARKEWDLLQLWRRARFLEAMDKAKKEGNF